MAACTSPESIDPLLFPHNRRCPKKASRPRGGTPNVRQRRKCWSAYSRARLANRAFCLGTAPAAKGSALTSVIQVGVGIGPWVPFGHDQWVVTAPMAVFRYIRRSSLSLSVHIGAAGRDPATASLTRERLPVAGRRCVKIGDARHDICAEVSVISSVGRQTAGVIWIRNVPNWHVATVPVRPALGAAGRCGGATRNVEIARKGCVTKHARKRRESAPEPARRGVSRSRRYGFDQRSRP